MAVNSNRQSPSFYGADIVTGGAAMSVPSTEQIVAAITVAKGLLPLASERLHITVDEIIIKLASDPNAAALLTSYFKTSLLLDTYMNLHMFMSSLLQCITHGDYANDIKAMQAFTSLFSELTRGAPTAPINVNVFERTMALLPKEIREEVLSLVGPGENQSSQPRRVYSRTGNDDDDSD